MGDGAAGELDGPAGLPKNTAHGKGLDILYQTHDAIFLINKYHIDRKTHEERVDLPAARDDEGLALEKTASIQKPGHARNKTIGRLGVMSQDGILCAV